MAESKVKDDNFFLVSGWMLNRLNLKGIALQVFAIIYGFSQDGEGSFTGSLQYLCDFTNTSKHTVIKALKELVDRNYVTKTENIINGVQFNTYKTNALVVQKLHWGSAETAPGGSEESTLGGSAETAHNNISLDNKENIKKDIVNEVIELYHSICVSFPTLRAVSEKRKKAVAKLLKTYNMEDFRKVFENAESSSFLKGTGGGWKASFDWLIKEDNLLKVLEGSYADKKGRKEAVPCWMNKRELDEDEKRAIQRMMQEDVPNVGNSPDLAERAENLRRRLGNEQEAI